MLSLSPNYVQSVTKYATFQDYKDRNYASISHC